MKTLVHLIDEAHGGSEVTPGCKGDVVSFESNTVGLVSMTVIPISCSSELVPVMTAAAGGAVFVRLDGP